MAHEEISYGEWLALALPLVQLALVAIWLLLLYLCPCDVARLPTLHYTPAPLTLSQASMLACVALTVLGWASFSVVAPLKVRRDSRAPKLLGRAPSPASSSSFTPPLPDSRRDIHGPLHCSRLPWEIQPSSVSSLSASPLARASSQRHASHPSPCSHLHKTRPPSSVVWTYSSLPSLVPTRPHPT